MIVWPYFVALGFYIVVSVIVCVCAADYPRRMDPTDAMAFGLMWPLAVVAFIVQVFKIFPVVFKREYGRGKDF